MIEGEGAKVVLSSRRRRRRRRHRRHCVPTPHCIPFYPRCASRNLALLTLHRHTRENLDSCATRIAL